MALNVNFDAQLCFRWLFAGHFVFTVLVLMGNWPGSVYMFYNGVLLALLIWAEVTPPADCDLPLLKCLLVEAGSIFLDVLVMSTQYDSHYHGIEVFALVMAIFHFLARFPACFVLFRLREDRRTSQYGSAPGGTTTTVGSGGIFGGNQSSPAGYEEFPPSYGAGGGPNAGAAGYGHDTKPLAP